MAEISEYITTRQAAETMPLSEAQMRVLLRSGRLQGMKLGHDWLIHAPSLRAYLANRPRPGLKLGQKITRPRKIASV
jgi:excisionase family DNA binding protein